MDTGNVTHSEAHTRIYFSDFFGVPRGVVEDYGAFDVSLVADLPLFIDPFLLFNSSKPEYKQLHAEIIDYVRFLRDKSVSGEINEGLLKAWFTFSEVRQNWLGYSEEGNYGSGLGMKFARDFNASLHTIFNGFGREEVGAGSHLEKLLLIGSGVGRDNISDFVTNTIKHYLLEFTERFAIRYLPPAKRRRIAVRKAVFNYSTESWVTRSYELPFTNGDYIILTPIDILTKDEVWINRTDMVRDYSHIAESIDDEQLRAQVSNYFNGILEQIRVRDFEQKRRAWTSKRKPPREMPPPNKRQKEEAAWAVIKQYPGYMDYYVRYKEEHGEEAEAQAGERVRSSERIYIDNVRTLASQLRTYTQFYNNDGSTLEAARTRVGALRDVVENHGGWQQLHVDEQPVPTEKDLRIIVRFLWTNTPAGTMQSGPQTSVVEFKHAKNPLLERLLLKHRNASSEAITVKGIMYFTDDDRARVIGFVETLKLADDPNIILIDARQRGEAGS